MSSRKMSAKSRILQSKLAERTEERMRKVERSRNRLANQTKPDKPNPARQVLSKHPESMEFHCVYCQDMSDTLDHVTPRSYSGITSYARCYVVPCCRECNCLLGSRAFITIGGRATYLKAVYESRYAKELRIPDWNEDEISKLGRKMRAVVIKGLEIKKLIAFKIKSLEMVSEISPSIDEVWIAIGADDQQP